MGNATGMGTRFGMVSHQIGESHAVKAIGRGKVQSRCTMFLSMWPCDTGSTRFSREGMYLSEIVMDSGIREDVIQCRQSFCVDCEIYHWRRPLSPVLSE